MNIFKTIIATAALSAVAVTAAHARDALSIGLHIGGHGHASHSVRHHHAPIYHGHYAPRAYAPRVVYYDVPNTRHHHRYSHGVSYRGHGYGHHVSRHSNKRFRHYDRGHRYNRH